MVKIYVNLSSLLVNQERNLKHTEIDYEQVNNLTAFFLPLQSSLTFSGRYLGQ